VDPAERSTWCFVARAVFYLYNDSEEFVNEFILTQLPDVEFVTSQVDGTGLTPQYVMWKAKCGRGIIFAGTNNYQQACTQVIYGANGPVAVGPFYTSRFWYDKAQELRTAFDAFAGPHEGSTFMGGHSYGGAIAGLMASLEVTPENRDEYALVTIGAPRLGNGEVYRRLSKTESVFLQNVDDPIPSLPPSYPTLTDLLPILGPAAFFQWQRWAPPPTCVVIREDRSTYLSSGWNAPSFTANAIATAIHAHDILPIYENHRSNVYRIRLCST
jgi:hypothetical protein